MFKHMLNLRGDTLIRISFGRQNLTGWEKKRYAETLSRIILRTIQFNRVVKDNGNFVDVELRIKFR